MRSIVRAAARLERETDFFAPAFFSDESTSRISQPMNLTLHRRPWRTWQGAAPRLRQSPERRSHHRLPPETTCQRDAFDTHRASTLHPLPPTSPLPPSLI